VKNRFQNSPFKCNLQRYGAVQMSNAVKVFLAFDAPFWPEGLFDVVGLCTLNQVDP
jgi:hypothetical protein